MHLNTTTTNLGSPLIPQFKSKLKHQQVSLLYHQSKL